MKEIKISLRINNYNNLQNFIKIAKEQREFNYPLSAKSKVLIVQFISYTLSDSSQMCN